MGIEAKFSVNQVMGAIYGRVDRANEEIEDLLEKASREVAGVIWDLAPVKTGTLQNAIRREKQSDGSWVVYIDTSVQVPGKNYTLAKYIGKIEAGAFSKIGPKSQAKEDGGIDKVRLAQMRIQRSPQGTYVGGTFYSRAIEVLIPRWEKRIAKAFRSALRKKGIFLRGAGGKFV